MVLTAELQGSPLVWFSAGINTLSGELRECVAEAQGVGLALCAGVGSAAAAVTDISHTGTGEGGHIYQTLAAGEGWPCEYLLAERALEGRVSSYRLMINNINRSGNLFRHRFFY